MGMFRFCAVLMLAVAILGCRQSTPVAQPQGAPVEGVKSRLEVVAETGQVGSEMILIEEDLKRMQETDPAKAGELLSDLEQLQATVDPERAKSLAKEMLGKL
jgi:hypothetical protein